MRKRGRKKGEEESYKVGERKLILFLVNLKAFFAIKFYMGFVYNKHRRRNF